MTSTSNASSNSNDDSNTEDNHNDDKKEVIKFDPVEVLNQIHNSLKNQGMMYRKHERIMGQNFSVEVIVDELIVIKSGEDEMETKRRACLHMLDLVSEKLNLCVICAKQGHKASQCTSQFEPEIKRRKILKKLRQIYSKARRTEKTRRKKENKLARETKSCDMRPMMQLTSNAFNFPIDKNNDNIVRDSETESDTDELRDDTKMIFVVNPCSVLQQKCNELGFVGKIKIVDMTNETEREHRHFKAKVQIGTLTSTGTGNNLKEAQYYTALNMMDIISKHIGLCLLCAEKGHKVSNCPHDTKIVYRIQEPKLDKEYLKQLESMLNRIKVDITPNDSLKRRRQEVVDDLTEYLNTWIDDATSAATLTPFGSSSNGFVTTTSDLDLSLTFNGLDSKPPAINQVKVIRELASILRELPGIKSVYPVICKVPIVKLAYKGFDVDISFYNLLARSNTEMILQYSELDSRFKTLGYIVKYFAKKCDIGDASIGKLSSYTYLIMMIFFLQQTSPPVLPVLQQMHKNPKQPEAKRFVENYNVWYQTDKQVLSKWKSENTLTVSELWIKFLSFYAGDWDDDTLVVSIRQIEPLTKDQKKWKSKKLCVEDPFKLDRDLGLKVKLHYSEYIKRTFLEVRDRFANPKPNIMKNFPERKFFQEIEHAPNKNKKSVRQRLKAALAKLEVTENGNKAMPQKDDINENKEIEKPKSNENQDPSIDECTIKMRSNEVIAKDINLNLDASERENVTDSVPVGTKIDQKDGAINSEEVIMDSPDETDSETSLDSDKSITNSNFSGPSDEVPIKELNKEKEEKEMDNVLPDKEVENELINEETNMDASNIKDYQEIQDTYGHVYKNKCTLDVCDWTQISTTQCDDSMQEVEIVVKAKIRIGPSDQHQLLAINQTIDSSLILIHDRRPIEKHTNKVQ